MARLPLLRTGASTQYPFARTLERRSRVLQFSDGREQRFPLFLDLRKRWRMKLNLLSDPEAAAIEAFVDQQAGRGGVFEFEDPIDGSVATRCRLESDSMAASIEGIGRCSTSLAVVEEPQE